MDTKSSSNPYHAFITTWMNFKPTVVDALVTGLSDSYIMVENLYC